MEQDDTRLNRSDIQLASDGDTKLHIEDAPLKAAPPEDSTKPCCSLAFKWRFFALFIFVGAICVLMIACIFVPSWIYAHSKAVTISGGLYKCVDCREPFGGLMYSEAAMHTSCDESDEMMGCCDLFEDLKGAGMAFLAFDVPSLVLSLIWCIKLFLEFKPSLCFSTPSYLFRLIAVSSLGLHSLALLIWLEVTRASFSSNCDNGESQVLKPDLCSTAGPSLAIVVLILQAVACWLYFLVANCSEEEDEKHQSQLNASQNEA